jgi:hypothetical protein
MKINNKSTDHLLNPRLKKEVKNMRSIIRSNQPKLPDRFTATPVEGMPQMIITDNESNKTLVIGLCDYRGVMQALQTFC